MARYTLKAALFDMTNGEVELPDGFVFIREDVRPTLPRAVIYLEPVKPEL